MRFLILFLLVSAAGFAIWAVLRRRLASSVAPGAPGKPEVGPPRLLDATPNLPWPFGYKSVWLAVRTEDPQAVMVDEGELTPEERALGHDFSAKALAFPDENGEEADEHELPTPPNEDDVLEVAARWSLDPRTLDEAGFPPSTGWFTSAKPTL